MSVKKKLFRKLRKFIAKNIENMLALSRSLFFKSLYHNSDEEDENKISLMTLYIVSST